MEVNHTLLMLIGYGRTFCGLPIDDAYAVGKKAIEIAGKKADEIDLIDAFEDVWGASMLAGTITEGGNTPPHPHDWKTRSLNIAIKEQNYADAMTIKDMDIDDFPKQEPIPERYKDRGLIAQPNKKLNRRPWDKGGD